MESKSVFDSDRESGGEDGNSGFPGREIQTVIIH